MTTNLALIGLPAGREGLTFRDNGKSVKDLDNMHLQRMGEHMKKLIAVAVVATLMSGCGMIQNGIKKCMPIPEKPVVNVYNTKPTMLARTSQLMGITAGTFSILSMLSDIAAARITSAVVAGAAIIGTVGALVYDEWDSIKPTYEPIKRDSTDGNTEKEE